MIGGEKNGCTAHPEGKGDRGGRGDPDLISECTTHCTEAVLPAIWQICTFQSVNEEKPVAYCIPAGVKVHSPYRYNNTSAHY